MFSEVMTLWQYLLYYLLDPR